MALAAVIAAGVVAVIALSDRDGDRDDEAHEHHDDHDTDRYDKVDERHDDYCDDRDGEAHKSDRDREYGRYRSDRGRKGSGRSVERDQRRPQSESRSEASRDDGSGRFRAPHDRSGRGEFVIPYKLRDDGIVIPLTDGCHGVLIPYKSYDAKGILVPYVAEGSSCRGPFGPESDPPFRFNGEAEPPEFPGRGQGWFFGRDSEDGEDGWFEFRFPGDGLRLPFEQGPGGFEMPEGALRNWLEQAWQQWRQRDGEGSGQEAPPAFPLEDPPSTSGPEPGAGLPSWEGSIAQEELLREMIERLMQRFQLPPEIFGDGLLEDGEDDPDLQESSTA